VLKRFTRQILIFGEVIGAGIGVFVGLLLGLLAIAKNILSRHCSEHVSTTLGSRQAIYRSVFQGAQATLEHLLKELVGVPNA
jgi:uncharacterized membrane protein